MHLSLIPTTLRSVLSLMQQGEWESVETSLDFLWGIIPPKTAAKLKERPSIELRKAMKAAEVKTLRALDARENEIVQHEQIIVARSKAGSDFCIGWVRTCINQLNVDGYLFEKSGVTPTAERQASEQPPSQSLTATLPRQ